MGEIEEVLTDNGQLGPARCAVGAGPECWPKHAPDDAHLIAATGAYAEQLMDKAALRAQIRAVGWRPFQNAAWHIEADDLTIRGFEPASRPNPPP